ncbi:uncharacterized protein SAPINGB_P004962 [Magnusiomyces paraingens]|uniref:Chromosome segregation in meiosis protein 3 domain-containing protein n=1 Tax=Magnusiomyces paraingens TaxID=2606893 RepID=A0A5E8C3G6_9ASCO|nr:uncharacterized protein SAPINGB_P004962 [Saprochaete ingens]VVT56318.1 unnamed protein product [Saprochaete ingens]
MSSWDDEDDIFDGADFYNTLTSTNSTAKTRNPLPPPHASNNRQQLQQQSRAAPSQFNKNPSSLDLDISGLPIQNNSWNNNSTSRPGFRSNAKPYSRPNTTSGETDTTDADAAAIELGIADEMPVATGRKAINRAKLDEDRLLDPVLGIPFLQKNGIIPSFLSQKHTPPSSPPLSPVPSFLESARPRPQSQQQSRVLRGKGHERGDLHRLLQFYQLWAHKLYPVRFDDFIVGALRVGDRPRMKRMRREWLDEEYSAVGAAAKRVRTDELDSLDKSKTTSTEKNSEREKAQEPQETTTANASKEPRRRVDIDSMFVSGPGAEIIDEDEIDPDDSFDAYFHGSRSIGSTTSTTATSLPASDSILTKDLESRPTSSSSLQKDSSPPFVFDIDDDEDEDRVVVTKKHKPRRIDDDDDDEDDDEDEKKDVGDKPDEHSNDNDKEIEENDKPTSPASKNDSVPFEISDTEPADDFEESALAMAEDMGF